MVTIKIEKFRVVFSGPSKEVIEVQNYYRVHGFGKMLNDMVCVYNQGDLVLHTSNGTDVQVRII